MPGFDAGTVVEPLTWDFTAFKAGKGTIPEPSDDKLGKFVKAVMAAQQGEAESLASIREAGDDQEKMLAAIAALPEDALPGVTRALIGPYADLCSGCPSEEQIGKLPPRVRTAFFAWLAGELNPEASGAASRPALRSVS